MHLLLHCIKFWLSHSVFDLQSFPVLTFIPRVVSVPVNFCLFATEADISLSCVLDLYFPCVTLLFFQPYLKFRCWVVHYLISAYYIYYHYIHISEWIRLMLFVWHCIIYLCQCVHFLRMYERFLIVFLSNFRVSSQLLFVCTALSSINTSFISFIIVLEFYFKLIQLWLHLFQFHIILLLVIRQLSVSYSFKFLCRPLCRSFTDICCLVFADIY